MIALLAGTVAAAPPPGQRATVIVFRQGSDPAANLGAVAPFGRILWASAAGDAVALEGTKLASLRLYALGAVLVSSTPVLGGCLNWAELRA